MKKINKLFTLLSIIFFASCSSDKGPVARYKKGVISGEEVIKRAQGAKLTPRLKRTIIESLAVEGMALREALANGYNKNEIYRLRLQRGTTPLLVKYVNEKSRKGDLLSWDYVKCRFVQFPGGNNSTSQKEAYEKALKAIALLKKGVEFENLADSYPPDSKNTITTSAAFVIKGESNPLIEEKAFSLPTGNYFLAPVVIQGGSAVIIKAEGKGKLTFDNLEKIVKAPHEQKRLLSLFNRVMVNRITAYLEKNNYASFRVNTLPSGENDLLFTISGKNYTLKDLKKRRDLFSVIIREPLEEKSFLLRFAREWYMAELYKAEAEKKGYLNDKVFAAKLKSAADFILANDYIRHTCEKGISVTEKEMFDEYSQNKNHYMKRPKTGSKKFIQLSYGEAKVFVRKNLIQLRVSRAMDEWRKKTLADSGLVIIN